MHTTNYTNTFIVVADDCPALVGEIPPSKTTEKSVAQMQFERISKKPYHFTSDEILFQVYAERNGITTAEMKQAKETFFSKGQACLRASPLAKRYGWGLHFNQQSKVAMYAVDSEAYQKFKADPTLKIEKAMRLKRK